MFWVVYPTECRCGIYSAIIYKHVCELDDVVQAEICSSAEDYERVCESDRIIDKN
jgi:hypothetical protein